MTCPRFIFRRQAAGQRLGLLFDNHFMLCQSMSCILVCRFTSMVYGTYMAVCDYVMGGYGHMDLWNMYATMCHGGINIYVLIVSTCCTRWIKSYTCVASQRDVL